MPQRLALPDSLSERRTAAVRQLIDLISGPEFVLHSQLPPERELADMLQLSRSGLRDALQVLEDEGRIWRRVGKGTFVGGRPQSVRSRPESLGAATTLSEILEFRALMEPITAELAALRAEPRDLAMMDEYLQRSEQAEGWRDWEKWDGLLHRAIAEASGNGLLISSIDQVLRVKMHERWTVQRAAVFDKALTARWGREHHAIVDHIANHDGPGARQAMVRHMASVSTTVGPTITPARVCAEPIS